MPAERRDRPHVSANFAITWDGRIAARQQPGATFSSPVDKARFLEIRAAADAVLVTARTAAADRMTLGLPKARLRTARQARGQAPYPLRVLISQSGRIDPTLPVFQKTFSPLVIFSTKRMSARTQAALQPKADLRLSDDRVDLSAMLRLLRRDFQVRHLHCEGGGNLFHSLLAADLIDDLHLTLCPRIFGGLTTPTLTGRIPAFLPHSIRADLKEMIPIGDECFLRYEVNRAPRKERKN